jgi:streptogrisin C
LAVAAAVVAVGATVYVAGAMSSATAEGSRSASGDKVVLSAVSRDLSLSPAETSTRLAKEAWAGRTERTLSAKLGTDFAGAWMSKTSKTLMVGVTTDAAADTVRAAGATPKLVDRSAAQLTTLKDKLDATRAATPSVTGWYVDPPSNSVVLVAKAGDTSAAWTLAAEQGVPKAAVRVVTTKSAPRLLADVKGGDAYLIDNQFRCSVGFAVTGGFVSAGHCGTPGSTTTDINGVAQGTFKASTFPGTGDFSFIETDSTVTPQPVVATTSGDVPVAGSEEAPIGAAICRTGSTTGTHCGVIQAKDATVNYPEGTVTGLTQTNVCAEGGDSGGSWMSGDQAQGVTSGGDGDCTVGGTTFFQPLNEILTVDKLTLITTSGAATPAPTDPAVTDPPATDPPATVAPTTPPATTTPGGHHRRHHHR